ncbi:MAG TPA: glucuronate isomerase [Clostridiales bacterium]|jgi:glucuronate isomerase|nr:glucuronate isomerase [Clostridiales bacterium]
MFMDENFLLMGKTAQTLYHEVAKPLPIIDYHCHLSPAEIANNRRFSSITQAWLGGDHYKWRLMRIAGVDEALITGNGDDFEKFLAFAKTIEKAIGNPVYHWTHLEMQRYFGIFEPLTAKNAKDLYDRMNQQIAEPSFSARGLIERSNVEVICTTDDPVDTLEYHRAVAADPIPNCTVRPTFRPDRAVLIDKSDFSDYVTLLSKAANVKIETFSDFLAALESRVDFFHENGCRLSDHDFGTLPSVIGTEHGAAAAFEKKQNGGTLSAEEADGFKSYVMLFLAGLFAKRNWVMQLHCGAQRNNSTKMFNAIGKDTGFDTMSDYEVALRVSRLLDAMEQSVGLPKTILYSLNPKDNYPMIALCGCFTAPGVAAKTQYGSAWWFIDHKEGMEKQMMDTANLNLLSTFVGMLTDSRSFLSYPRHEYFRRILCNLVGRLVDNGEFPADRELLSSIVAGVSYENAKAFFQF